MYTYLCIASTCMQARVCGQPCALCSVLRGSWSLTWKNRLYLNQLQLPLLSVSNNVYWCCCRSTCISSLRIDCIYQRMLKRKSTSLTSAFLCQSGCSGAPLWSFITLHSIFSPELLTVSAVTQICWSFLPPLQLIRLHQGFHSYAPCCR